MPYANSVVGGGGSLVRTLIKSPNFVHGVSGWQIAKDGSAEFQNIIARGDISASTLSTTRMTVDATGNVNFFNAFGAIVIRIDAQQDAIFLYLDTGSAVQGDLNQIISVASGNDPIKAQSYDAGMESWGGVRTLKAVLNSASLTLTKLSGAFAPPQISLNDNVLNNANVIGSTGLSLLLGAGANIIRAQLTTDTGVRFQVDSSGTVQWGAGVPTFDTLLYRAAGGGALGVSGLLQDLSGVGDTFHSISVTPGFANGWLDGGRAPCKYKAVPSPANSVQMVGSLLVPAGFAAGQAMTAAFSAVYRPNNNQSIPACNTTNNLMVRLNISPGGVFTFGGPIANVAAGNVLDYSFCYSLSA